MEAVKIEAKKRTDLGKKSTKDIRRQGEVPCNIYGGEENISFSLEYNKLKKGIFTDKFKVFELDIEGNVKKAIAKEVQFHPVSDKMIHVDFQELVPGKFVKTSIPIITKGFSLGQKEGGKLEVKLRKVDIKAPSDNLPEHIEIDITNLNLGQSLRVKDLNAEGFEILNTPSVPIVSVIVPRALRGGGDQEADEEGTEDAESGEEGAEESSEEKTEE